MQCVCLHKQGLLQCCWLKSVTSAEQWHQRKQQRHWRTCRGRNRDLLWCFNWRVFLVFNALVRWKKKVESWTICLNGKGIVLSFFFYTFPFSLQFFTHSVVIYCMWCVRDVVWQIDSAVNNQIDFPSVRNACKTQLLTGWMLISRVCVWCVCVCLKSIGEANPEQPWVHCIIYVMLWSLRWLSVCLYTWRHKSDRGVSGVCLHVTTTSRLSLLVIGRCEFQPSNERTVSWNMRDASIGTNVGCWESMDL